MSKKKPDWEADSAELKRAELELAEYFDKHGERSEADIAKALVARAKLEHDRTGNPLHIWFAYAECRSAKLQIPEWILCYLDQVTWNLWELSRGPRPGEKNLVPDKPYPAIAKALEMDRVIESGKLVRANVFKKFVDMSPWAMAYDVISLILQGHKDTVAGEIVAEARGASRSKVLAAYKKYIDIIPHPKRPPPKSSKN